MKRLAFAILLLVSACATTPVSTAGIPSGPLDLGGEWRTAPIGSVFHQFQGAVQSRYRPGLALASAAGDLGRQGFRCAANSDTRPDTPDQICRKTVTFERCTHTWQVHLYDQTTAGVGGALSRTRALYDRRCGGEGLLGGPT